MPLRATRAHREAIASLRRGDWQTAHLIVQALEDPLAYRIHALCHRIEGDMDNACYWYRRAKMPVPKGLDVAAELAVLEGEY